MYAKIGQLKCDILYKFNHIFESHIVIKTIPFESENIPYKYCSRSFRDKNYSTKL